MEASKHVLQTTSRALMAVSTMLGEGKGGVGGDEQDAAAAASDGEEGKGHQLTAGRSQASLPSHPTPTAPGRRPAIAYARARARRA